MLETYDWNSLDQPTLRIDYIDILIEQKLCDITQAQVTSFCNSKLDFYKMQAQLGVGWVQVMYSDLFDTAYHVVFGLDDPDRDSCGELTTEVFTPYPFLVDFPSLQTVQLKPEYTDAEGVYTEAYQTFTVNGFSCDLQMTATVWDCDLISVGFMEASVEVEYEIGSGQLSKSLPKVEQKPNCNLDFNEFAIVETQTSNDLTLVAVNFDNGTVKINSDDFTLNTHTLRLFVSVVTDIIVTEPMIFDITFKNPELKFDMDSVDNSPLSCSEDDANWVLKLPIADTGSSQVSVEMTTVSEYFTYDQELQAVTLQDSVKDKIVSGSYCPDFAEVQLDFLLKSDILGSSSTSISIGNSGDPFGSLYDFKGVIVGDEDDDTQVIEIPKLKVAKCTIN